MDVKGSYFLKHPGEQKFNRYTAFLMGLLSLKTEMWYWYQRPKSKLYTMQQMIVIVFCPITCFSQAIYLYLHHKEHDSTSVIAQLIIMPVGFVVMIKTAIAQTRSYRIAMKAYMDNIHMHRYDVSQYGNEKRKFIIRETINAEKYTRWTFYILMSVVLICCFAWNVVPVIHNIQNNHSIHNITTRLEVCIHFWQPFDYEYNFYAYVYIQIIAFYCGSVAVIIMVLFDTTNFAMIFHLVGHLKILKYNLKTGFSKDMEDEDAKKNLVDITQSYCFITDAVKVVESAFGLNIIAVYLQNLIQGALLFYQMMTIEKNTETIFMYGLMIPVIFGILIVISSILENVRIQANDIPTLLYELPWEYMSIPNQKILLHIMLQVQQTLEFKAAFNIKTGIQPAINIIKTTFSYYTMIKSNRM